MEKKNIPIGQAIPILEPNLDRIARVTEWVEAICVWENGKTNV